MNIMPILSVVIFLVLLGSSLAVYRYLRRETDDADGAYGVNMRGELNFSDEKNIVGEIQTEEEAR